MDEQTTYYTREQRDRDELEDLNRMALQSMELISIGRKSGRPERIAFLVARLQLAEEQLIMGNRYGSDANSLTRARALKDIREFLRPGGKS